MQKVRGESIKQSNKYSSRVHCVQTSYRVLEGSEKLNKRVSSFRKVQCGQFQWTEEEGQCQIRGEPRKGVNHVCRDSKLAGVSRWHLRL